MYDQNQLCQKIRSIYPDIGRCGIDLTVEYDGDQSSWVVHLKKGNHTATHFLEKADLDMCMEGIQCVSLGLEISLIRDY